jgi:DNA-binding transcriptional regulator YiaG
MESINIRLRSTPEYTKWQIIKFESLSQIFEHFDNNKTQVAKYLGVSLRSVRNWSKELRRYEMFKRYPN